MAKPLISGIFWWNVLFFLPFMLRDLKLNRDTTEQIQRQIPSFLWRMRVFLLNSTGWYESTVIKHRVTELFSDQPLRERKQSRIYIRILNWTRLINSAVGAIVMKIHWHSFVSLLFLTNTTFFKSKYDSRFLKGNTIHSVQVTLHSYYQRWWI